MPNLIIGLLNLNIIDKAHSYIGTKMSSNDECSGKRYFALISGPDEIQLEVALAGDAVISCHRGQFLQVLLNLINNAIQALASSDALEKRISLRGYQDPTNYVLEISDTGPGVPVLKQLHLFGLLSSDKSSGMGVGLWLCAHIMNNAGGKISYEDATGGGAKFILSFPSIPPRAVVR